MSLTADMLRGNTDTIILRFLKEKDNYGYAINREIMRLTNGKCELNEATLYTSFKRLEKQGYIQSYWGNEDSGARRKYYKMTTKGLEQYEQNVAQWLEAKEIMEVLIR